MKNLGAYLGTQLSQVNRFKCLNNGLKARSIINLDPEYLLVLLARNICINEKDGHERT